MELMHLSRVMGAQILELRGIYMSRRWAAVLLVAFGVLFASGASAQTSVERNLDYCQRLGSQSALCNTRLLTARQRAHAEQATSRLLSAAWLTEGLCNRRWLTGSQVASVSAPSVAVPTVGACAENGTCYGDISEVTGRPKTVQVAGYYRKNGTYVRGHYRSAPRRK
jgi:hypothetical protein